MLGDRIVTFFTPNIILPFRAICHQDLDDFNNAGFAAVGTADGTV